MEAEKLVDLVSVVASSFTVSDIDILVEELSLGSCERLGDDWILTPSGLAYAKDLFTATLNARADKAATKKVVTIITEDDLEKSEELKPTKAKKGATGGGRGAREPKTKGKDKKRNKKKDEKEAEEESGALTEDEINSVLEEDETLSMLDEYARQALGNF